MAFVKVSKSPRERDRGKTTVCLDWHLQLCLLRSTSSVNKRGREKAACLELRQNLLSLYNWPLEKVIYKIRLQFLYAFNSDKSLKGLKKVIAIELCVQSRYQTSIRTFPLFFNTEALILPNSKATITTKSAIFLLFLVLEIKQFTEFCPGFTKEILCILLT